MLGIDSFPSCSGRLQHTIRSTRILMRRILILGSDRCNDAKCNSQAGSQNRGAFLAGPVRDGGGNQAWATGSLMGGV